MPRSFDFPLIFGRVDIWRPFTMTAEERTDRRNQFLNVIGRLKPGVSIRQADAQMKALAARLAHDHPDPDARAGLRLIPLLNSVQAEPGRQGLWLLLGLTGFVLLIACANLANLQLARTARRSRELALRAALGAATTRLMRQLLTESFLIALLGGALGILLAAKCNEFLSRRLAFGIDIPLDVRVIGFALTCCIVTVVGFGVAPAWLAVRAGFNDQLKDNARGAIGGQAQHRFRSALIVGQVSLALILLSGAAGTVRMLQRFARLHPGWQFDGLLTARLSLPAAKYDSHQRRAVFYEQLQARLSALPGVKAASLSSELPVWSFANTCSVTIQDQPPAGRGDEPLVYCPTGNPDYFSTLGINLIRGRNFTIADTLDRPAVAIINQSMARRFWPAQDPLGKRVSLAAPDDPHWMEIVGVVNDVRFPANPTAPETDLQIYRPLAQDPFAQGVMIGLRSTASPDAIAPAVRAAVAELDPDLPLYNLQTVQQIIDASMNATYLMTGLLGGFGILGLALAALGIYGVTSHSTAQRTGEIGIRMALGAQTSDVLWLVLCQGLRWGLLGAILGLGGAFAVLRILAGLFPLDSPMHDPVSLAGVPVAGWLVSLQAAFLLITVTLLACFFPARRATRITPMTALRCE